MPMNVKRIMPGIKNVSKGECFSNPNGACRNSPKGSIIKAPPPNKAETELKNRSVMQENRIIVFISVLYDPGLIYYKNKILFRHGKANLKPPSVSPPVGGDGKSISIKDSIFCPLLTGGGRGRCEWSLP